MTNAVRDYYSSVAPFYEAEMACRADIPDWVALARTLDARRILDLGSGNGRVGRALGARARVVGVDLLRVLLRAPTLPFVQGDLRALPFRDRSFDLAIAANDPFAHLLDEDERAHAVGEATRVAGRVVIDGLRLTPSDRAATHDGGLLRERELPGGIRRCERWTAAGGDRFHTEYRYVRGAETIATAAIDVREWSPAEPALRHEGVRLAGGLDGRPFDPAGAGLVVMVGGDR
jgi:SAM-dependent methyltransferase